MRWNSYDKNTRDKKDTDRIRDKYYKEAAEKFIVRTQPGDCIAISGVTADFTLSGQPASYSSNSYMDYMDRIVRYKPVCWGCGAFFDKSIMRRCEYCGGTNCEII